MKKLGMVLAAVVVALMGVLSGVQAATVTNLGQVITVTTLSELADSTTQVRTWVPINIALLNTNAVTDVTLVTPLDVGTMLIGQYGTGTDGVWIANGPTTNDWVLLAPVTP